MSKSLKAWINLKETDIKDPEKKVKNVSNIGHHGVGDYEYKIYSEEDLFYFNKLFEQSYNEKI